MDLELWKQQKKCLKLTNKNISDLSGIPLRTVEAIFVGKTQYPRSDTVDAIETVLGINQDKNTISPAERELFDLINQLDEEEVKELSNFLDFIVSKRKWDIFTKDYQYSGNKSCKYC